MPRLVSEDNEVVVEVPSGEMVVGRGPLLNIMDKRVSRKHATLEWKNGNLRFCPRHHNPCFLMLAGESKYSPLTRDKWVELHHGDHIALLPESLVYRVELRVGSEVWDEGDGEGVEEGERERKETSRACQETEAEGGERSPVATREKRSSPVAMDSPLSPVPGKRSSPVAVDSPLCPVPGDREERSPVTVDSPLCPVPGDRKERSPVTVDSPRSPVPEKRSSPVAVDSPLCPVPGDKEKRSSPVAVDSPLYPVPGPGPGDREERSSPVAVDSPLCPVPGEIRGREERDQRRSDAAAASSVRKRALPAWLCDVKVETRKTTATSKVVCKPAKPAAAERRVCSIKPATTAARRRAPSVKKAVEATVRTEVGSTSPNLDQPATKKRPAKVAALSDEEDLTPQAKRPTPTPRLEGAAEATSKVPPCPYGAECYRKNPVHFKEYSHDSVAEEDRPECPYGVDCYRKNPAHRKNYKHSGAAAKPPAPKRASRARTRKTKPHVSALAGDSDDSGGPNTYDYTDSFIDNAEAGSDSTSYGGESEDSDWAPPEGGGGGGGGEEESPEVDVGELMEEANSFITNKKMWQP